MIVDVGHTRLALTLSEVYGGDVFTEDLAYEVAATNMLRMEPTSAACLEQVAKCRPEGSSRLYAELEGRLKIFDKGNHSMFKGLEDGHNSLGRNPMCVLHRALRFTTRPGRPVGELLHSDVISEDSAKIAFSPHLQGGDDEAEGNIMHKGLDAGAVGFLSDSDNEEGDDAGPDGLGDQVEGNEQEGDGDESVYGRGTTARASRSRSTAMVKKGTNKSTATANKAATRAATSSRGRTRRQLAGRQQRYPYG
ncbi:unnamed protein product [Ectocarpus sp. CCAP 1310/34]|nr:unnamed protein product [Ectocarpus sp. CCAP 1310/34]